MDSMRERREADDLLRVTWPQLHCQEGDTRVIVDFPSFCTRNCHNVLWNRADFRMNSLDLLATGSATFKAAFSDANQRRFRRRHQLDPLPSDIRYVIDLTPSLEGDDAAFLVGELSLPVGVRDWWMAKERFGVSASLVSGHDDDCHDHDMIPTDCQTSSDWNPQPLEVQGDKKHRITLGLQHVLNCPAREIRDYCEIRHRVNIIRLLLTIAGYDLVLNSAPRVFTLVALAKQFDVVDLITSPVRAWLEDPYNSSFIDVHPEIALEMAWKLQLSDVVRAALRILVVERALEPADVEISQTTKLGRPRTSLSDDISTVVQHATNSFRIRVKEAAKRLHSDIPHDWLQAPAWKTLLRVGEFLEADFLDNVNHDFEQAIKNMLHQFYEIVETVSDYIKTMIHQSTKATPGLGRRSEIDNDRLAYAKAGSPSIESIIKSLDNEDTLLFPFFWMKLKDETDNMNTFFEWTTFSGRSSGCLGNTMEAFLSKVNGGIAKGMLPSLQFRFPEGLSFDIFVLHDQIRTETYRLWQAWVPYHGDLEMPLLRTTHLALGFTEDEFKFLPLWAGGLDDETGAVFDDMTVPDTDMGPSQPGPTYVTGKSIAPSSTADSDITIVGGGMSVQANRSGMDTSADGSQSRTAESFVEVSASDHAEYSSMVHDDSMSLENAMGDIGIFSDSSEDGMAEFHDDTNKMDDSGTESGDMINDTEGMGSDSEWSDIQD